jgi:hypothetical protein
MVQALETPGNCNDLSISAAVVKKRLREQYRTLDPVALLAEIRAAQEELGNRVDRRAGNARGQQPAGKNTTPQPVQSSTPDAVAFAKTLGTTVEAGDPRATHRRPKRPYKTRVRMPSKLDPHVVTIEYWLAAEPQLTALAIVGRLNEKHPEQFGMRQHSIVQRLLKALRKKAAEKFIAQKPPCAATIATKDNPRTHHDVLEFPDGQMVLLNDVFEGQEATVLQLPAQPVTAAEIKAQERVPHVG